MFDHDGLVGLAADAGLDPAEVARVLADGAYADAVGADVLQARWLGVTGVPFFVVDRRYGVAGAQPAEVLRSVLRQVWDDAHPVELVGSGGGDEACEDESCVVQ